MGCLHCDLSRLHDALSPTHKHAPHMAQLMAREEPDDERSDDQDCDVWLAHGKRLGVTGLTVRLKSLNRLAASRMWCSGALVVIDVPVVVSRI